MKDLNSILREQLKNKEIAREYYRIAPFYRLADQLILLRKQRGLTQQELAEKAKTTQTVISRLENVSVHASLESVVKLAEALEAVVDLNLVPIEENQNDFKRDQIPEEGGKDDENTVSEEIPGVVFFGQCQKATNQSVLWYQPDPINFGLHTERVRRKKQLEIA